MKIPSPEILKEMDDAAKKAIGSEVNAAGSMKCILRDYGFEHCVEAYHYWNHNPVGMNVTSDRFLSSFFEWYELSETPLYKAMSEEKE